MQNRTPRIVGTEIKTGKMKHRALRPMRTHKSSKYVCCDCRGYTHFGDDYRCYVCGGTNTFWIHHTFRAPGKSRLKAWKEITDIFHQQRADTLRKNPEALRSSLHLVNGFNHNYEYEKKGNKAPRQFRERAVRERAKGLKK